MDVEFRRIRTNGITLNCALSGPEDGPLVFLLHGFPEFWYGWRNQIAPLALAGYRVVIPDQRGYNDSDKPKGVAAYDIDLLADDIAGLADALCRKRFAVVGHDWGGIVAWWLAQRHPERVERLAILNVGHPAVWMNAIRTNPAQRRLSYYVFIFSVRVLPEIALRAARFRAMTTALKQANRRDAFTDADLARYRAAWSKKGALTAMINWYRAVLRKDLKLSAVPRYRMPVRIIWGLGDIYGLPELATESAKLCDDARILYVEHATHWVAHEEPERVNRALLEFLAG
jgi:pimeloyl-ACP methyl ester carboxylesterase